MVLIIYIPIGYVNDPVHVLETETVYEKNTNQIKRINIKFNIVK